MAASMARHIFKGVVHSSRLLGSVQTSSRLSALAAVQHESTSAQMAADSEKPKVYVDPLKHPDYFKVHELFTMQDLFDDLVHLGHKEGSLNDYMRQYIFGNRLSHLILNLDQTAALLRDALNFTAHIAFRKGIILFVSRHRQTALTVERTARECGEYAHTRDWKPGTFTDSRMQFGVVTRLPDLVIFLHTLDNAFEQHIAVRDSAKLLIPSTGIVDTNCDPTLITYPVPGNDDTPKTVELYCKLYKEAILRGKAKQKEMEKEGTYPFY